MDNCINREQRPNGLIYCLGTLEKCLTTLLLGLVWSQYTYI